MKSLNESVGIKGKTIYSDSRNIVYNILNFFNSVPSFWKSVNFKQCNKLWMEACRLVVKIGTIK